MTFLNHCVIFLVNGGYGPWGSWADCSKTCGKEKGMKRRVRLCDHPAPENGGKDCSGLGVDSETKPCTPPIKKCPGMHTLITIFKESMKRRQFVEDSYGYRGFLLC